MKRSELLFIYDVRDANPNGDPIFENRPRMDEATGHVLVSDVRLKRYVRDYWIKKLRENSVFVRIFITESGDRGTREDVFSNEYCLQKLSECLDKIEKIGKKLKKQKMNDEDKKNLQECLKFVLEECELNTSRDSCKKCAELLDENERNVLDELSNKLKSNSSISDDGITALPKIIKKLIKEYLLNKFIDLRIFGALLTIHNRTISEIGPVQFGMGRSLNRVEPVKHGGTTVLASKKEKAQGTITEWWTVPYAVIAFYGIINPYFAKRTGMSENDVKELLEGMWKGIVAYTSRTKINQKPLLLMRVVYKDDDFEIGRIDEYVKIKSEKDDKEIRSPKDYEIDLSELVEVMKKFSDKIEKIEIAVDKSSAKFNVDGAVLSGEELIEKLKELGFNVSEVNFRALEGLR